MSSVSWVRTAAARSTAGRSAARLDHFELSPIKEVELRASRIPGVVSLAQGIPSFDTPEPVKRAVEEKMAQGLCARYSVSPGLPRLREAIADALQREGMVYDPDREILVTVGSIEAIAATLIATINPGDEVLVVSPTYASYLPAIHIAGGVPRFVPLDEEANFDLDVEAIAAATGRRTKALLLCNPNNPTGTIFSARQTRRMLDVAEAHDLVVITDEVYKDFVYGSERIYSAAMEAGIRRRVVRVCSFSKAYAMTGWRVGFLHGDAARVDGILKVHDALVTCAPVASQYAALAALELGESVITAFRGEFRRRRDRVVERLDALPHVFDYQKPNASYFVFPRVKDTVAHARDSRRLAAELLERARVAVVPGVAFGPTGEAHLRLCYARDEADIELAFDRMEDYFSGRPARRHVDLRPSAGPRPPAPRDVGVTWLRHLARARLKRQPARIVAIAGSQGKTVMKRCLHELLGGQFLVRANPLSHNTDVGLPLAVLGVRMETARPSGIALGFLRGVRAAYLARDAVDVMILELGVRRPGDARAHLEILRPDVLIVTPLVPSYSEDQEALRILREEVAQLVAAPSGHLLLCADDPSLIEISRGGADAVLFSAADVETGDGGATSLRVGDRCYEVLRDTVGASGRRAVSAAVRVARLLGVDDARCEAFLRGVKTAGQGRQRRSVALQVVSERWKWRAPLRRRRS